MKLNRKKSNINAKRWAAYAAAGLATTVGMNATTETADADIIVNCPGQVMDGGISASTVYSMTFGSGSGNNVTLTHVGFAATTAGRANMYGNGNVLVAGGTASSFAYPSNAAYCAAISGLSFGIPSGARGDMAWGAGYPNSNFLNAGTSYVAWQFTTAAGTQFGWAELTMDGSGAGNSFTIEKWAYTTDGVNDVAAGFSVGKVPEAGSLGLLALGGAGLAAWRRNRKPAA